MYLSSSPFACSSRRPGRSPATHATQVRARAHSTLLSPSTRPAPGQPPRRAADIIVNSGKSLGRAAPTLLPTPVDNGNRSLESAPADCVTLQHRSGQSHPPRLLCPDGVQVIARSQSGSVTAGLWTRAARSKPTRAPVTSEVEGVNGHLDVKIAVPGSITARDITGDADIATTSGDVKIFNLLGNADVSTVSGDVELRGVTGKTVRAKTTSGDVRFDGLIDAAGRYDFSAHSGDVEMHVQRDASAQLTDFDVERRRRQRFPHHAQAR